MKARENNKAGAVARRGPSQNTESTNSASPTEDHNRASIILELRQSWNPACLKAATMLERYLALADALRDKAATERDGSMVWALRYVERRLREIAEGREET